MKLARALVLCLAAPATAQLAVVSTQPPINGINVPRSSALSVTFDRPVNPATFTPASFGAFGKVSGPIVGSVAFSNGDQTVTLTPARPLAAGEGVGLVLSNALRGADGSALRAAGYTTTFTVATAPSAGEFCYRATLTDRDASGATTRIYGGVGCDLNRDGWADLTLVNEVSADLRVFINRADGSGLFGPMLAPPTPIPFETSPNEPADFDGDGFVDIVATSNATNQLSIAWGNGDGTFDPPTLITTGNFLRGLGIIDCDGDGDMDITVASRGTDQVLLLRNTGARTFAAPVGFASGGSGPYGMTAADMNADGILDLVVGHVQSQTVTVLRGNGNATFTQVSSRPIGGGNWVIVCGDVNNDGKIDVSAANSFSANASMLLGNGDGTLQPATVIGNGGHTTATDLADVDGDGDLDWMVSSFGASLWYLYRNNGAGQFTFVRTFTAPGNPACALAADWDNDGDIDLALLDETTDLMLIMLNSSPSCVANCDCSATPPALNVNDFVCFLNRFAANDRYANCDGSTTQPILNINDFVCFNNQFAAGCP
ncbi:MAG: FG-GAP-like repeat-containing protein [Phycisphaerales bacterium]